MEPSITHSLLEIGFQLNYAVTLLVAVWRYPLYFDTPLRFLPILFLYTFLTELLGLLVKANEDLALVFNDITDNSLIYNLYTIISYLYYYFIFWSFSKDTIYRKNILIGALLFLASSLVNSYFQNFASKAQTFAYLVGGCVLLYCSISYLWHFYKIPENFSLKQNIIFWLSLGLSIFYLGYLPIKILRFYNSIHQLSLSPDVKTVQFTLIIVMYTIIIIGFVKMRRPLRRVLEI